MQLTVRASIQSGFFNSIHQNFIPHRHLITIILPVRPLSSSPTQLQPPSLLDISRHVRHDYRRSPASIQERHHYSIASGSAAQ
jgi:hypothetical protein